MRQFVSEQMLVNGALDSWWVYVPMLLLMLACEAQHHLHRLTVLANNHISILRERCSIAPANGCRRAVVHAYWLVSGTS